MSRIEEIEKNWPKLFPINRTKGELCDFVVNANRSIRHLLTEVKRLRGAIEKHRDAPITMGALIISTMVKDRDEALYAALKEGE